MVLACVFVVSVIHVGVVGEYGEYTNRTSNFNRTWYELRESSMIVVTGKQKQ